METRSCVWSQKPAECWMVQHIEFCVVQTAAEAVAPTHRRLRPWPPHGAHSLAGRPWLVGDGRTVTSDCMCSDRMQCCSSCLLFSSSLACLVPRSLLYRCMKACMHESEIGKSNQHQAGGVLRVRYEPASQSDLRTLEQCNNTAVAQRSSFALN